MSIRRTNIHNKKRGNSLSMEKHMDILQACVMVPLPTPTWPMTSVCFHNTGYRRTMNPKVWGRKLFTQKATVCHEASGLQRSRPTGSSSHTKSEEETVKHTVHMIPCCPCPRHTDSGFNLGGSVVSLVKGRTASTFLSRQGRLFPFICFNQSKPDLWFLGLNHERKPKSSRSALDVTLMNFRQIDCIGAERRKSPPQVFSRSADTGGGETCVVG